MNELWEAIRVLNDQNKVLHKLVRTYESDIDELSERIDNLNASDIAHSSHSLCSQTVQEALWYLAPDD